MTITQNAQSAPERVVDGRSVPAAGTWTVDAAHSSVEFVARHLMVTKVRGRFGSYDATFEIGDRPEDSTLQVTIDAASISTGDEGRDGHLRGADFFDVEQYPTLTFASTGVTARGSSWQVAGDLTIHGVTRSVVLDVEYAGTAADPWGNTKAFFTAGAELDREDWGLSWNQPIANGGVLVGKKVKLELEIQATPTR